MSRTVSVFTDIGYNQAYGPINGVRVIKPKFLTLGGWWMTEKALPYTAIGHSSPHDAIWILLPGQLEKVSAGHTLTHDILWGGEHNIEACWRGRVDAKTGICSIVPPSGVDLRNPPVFVIDALRREFMVTEFYFYSGGGLEIFSPNPARRLK